MSSQLKAFRGIKKNLTKQVRGRAVKFRFTVTYEYLALKCITKWKPTSLSVVWFRSHRSKTSRKPTCHMTGSDEPDTIICNAKWNPPHSVDLVVTLYKDLSENSFRSKEYLFMVENVSKGERKKLAIFPCNMSGYVSMENEIFDLEMEFKTLSKKISSCKLGVKIKCEFIKEGNAGEDDMESNFSHLSEGDRINRMSELIECSDEEDEEKKHSDAVKIGERSKQNWSQFMNEMRTLEYKQLSLVENPLVEDRNEFNQLTSSQGLGSNRSLTTTTGENSSGELLSTSDRNGADSLDREVRNRRVVSAIVEMVDEEDEVEMSEKESEELSLPPYSSHSSGSTRSKFQFIFPKKRLERSETLPTELSSSEGAVPPKDKSKRRVEEWLLDVNDSHHDLRIKELEKENKALKERNSSLDVTVVELMQEKDELQAEISELQLLVEDLKTKLAQNEIDYKKAEEEKEILNKMELCQVRGWLCKRGVKGPTGHKWRRRWFATGNDGKLHYYKKNNNRMPRGYIDLEAIIAVQDRTKREQDINNALFNVITAGRTYELMAHDEEEKHRWINALDYLRHLKTDT